MNRMSHRVVQPVAIRTSIVLSVSLAALLALYQDTSASLAAWLGTAWSKDPLGHGYLVVAGSLYLVWSDRHRVALVRPTPTFWALVGIGGCALGWFVGELTRTEVVQHVSLIGMAASFMWGVLGTSAIRAVKFPLGLLVFAFPFLGWLVPVLQDSTAAFTAKMLSASGIPVIVQHHVISIPNGSWKVAEACSGINYLMSSLVIGYVYAGTAYRYWRHRLGFFLAAALMPLVGNALRVYGTILLASVWGNDVIEGTRHYLFGWLVFAFIVGVLMVTCGNWREERAGEETPNPTRGTTALVGAWDGVSIAVIGLLFASTATLSARLYEQYPVPAVSTPRLAVSSPWSPTTRNPFPWKPRFMTPSHEFLQAYDSGDRTVTVYMAYYAPDQRDVKLATVSNALFDRPWLTSAERRVRTMVSGEAMQMDETVLQRPGTSLLVRNWYWVGGTATASDIRAKVLLAGSRLMRERLGSAIIAVATTDDRGDADRVLDDFLEHFALAEDSPS